MTSHAVDVFRTNRENSMRKPSVFRSSCLGAALAAALCLGTPSSYAQETPILDRLLEKLKDRGILTDEEFEALKAEREQERVTSRAERRQRALREAQAAEKEEKDKEAAKSTLVGTFKDGFRFESGDKRHAIGISGRVHADYRYYADDAFANSFDVRRAYIGVQGKLYDIYTFDVTGDFAQSGSQLDVAWLNAAWFESAQLRMGQFKMPFSLEEQTSSRFIDFQERSMMNALVPAKERGFMIHGSPINGTFYGVALSNGRGKNVNIPELDVETDGPDVVARVGANAAEIAGLSNMVLHGAVGYSSGTLKDGVIVPAGRTEGRGVVFFGTPAIAADDDEVDRTRMGAELSLAWGPVKLQGEYTKASYEYSVGGNGVDNDIDAYYASASWLITGEQYAKAYKGGAYRAIVPNKPLGSGGLGAWEVGLRYTEFDAGDFTPTTGRTNKADAITVGLKWIPVTNVRLYLNYVQTNFDSTVTTVNNKQLDDEKAVTLRAALYF